MSFSGKFTGAAPRHVPLWVCGIGAAATVGMAWTAVAASGPLQYVLGGIAAVFAIATVGFGSTLIKRKDMGAASIRSNPDELEIGMRDGVTESVFLKALSEAVAFGSRNPETLAPLPSGIVVTGPDGTMIPKALPEGDLQRLHSLDVEIIRNAQSKIIEAVVKVLRPGARLPTGPIEPAGPPPVSVDPDASVPPPSA